jgi:hypothetical protein
MAVELGDIVQGLQLLGGVLSLPRQVQYQQQASDALRQNLTGTGMSQSQIDAAAPQPGLRWLSPANYEGIGGKVLGGVGDVGALISTIAGKPVGPPRTSISDLADLSKMRVAKQKGDAEENLRKILADPNSTPEQIRAGFGATGNIDATGRVTSALFGGANKGPTSIWSAQWQLDHMAADDPRRPALKQQIDDYQLHHPVPAPPKEDHYLPPDEAETQRINAAIAARRKAGIAGGLTGEDLENYALDRHPPQPAKPPADRPATFKEVVRAVSGEMARENPDKPIDNDVLMSRSLARVKAYEATTGDKVQGVPALRAGPQGPQEPPMSRDVPGTPPGTPPPQPPAPTPGVPQRAPAPTPQTPAPGPQSGLTGAPASPQQQALATITGQLQAGLSPASIQQADPVAWQTSGLTGWETVPGDLLSQYLTDPAFLAQLSAGDAAAVAAARGAGGATPPAAPGPSTNGALSNVPFDPAKLSPAAAAAYADIQAKYTSGELTALQARQQASQLIGR